MEEIEERVEEEIQIVEEERKKDTTTVEEVKTDTVDVADGNVKLKDL